MLPSPLPVYVTACICHIAVYVTCLHMSHSPYMSLACIYHKAYVCHMQIKFKKIIMTHIFHIARICQTHLSHHVTNPVLFKPQVNAKIWTPNLRLLSTKKKNWLKSENKLSDCLGHTIILGITTRNSTVNITFKVCDVMAIMKFYLSSYGSKS